MKLKVMIQGSLILKGPAYQWVGSCGKESRYFTFPMLSLFGYFFCRLQLWRGIVVKGWLYAWISDFSVLHKSNMLHFGRGDVWERVKIFFLKVIAWPQGSVSCRKGGVLTTFLPLPFRCHNFGDISCCFLWAKSHVLTQADQEISFSKSVWWDLALEHPSQLQPQRLCCACSSLPVGVLLKADLSVFLQLRGLTSPDHLLLTILFHIWKHSLDNQCSPLLIKPRWLQAQKVSCRLCTSACHLESSTDDSFSSAALRRRVNWGPFSISHKTSYSASFSMICHAFPGVVTGIRCLIRHMHPNNRPGMTYG